MYTSEHEANFNGFCSFVVNFSCLILIKREKEETKYQFCRCTPPSAFYNDNPLLIRLCTELDLSPNLSVFHRTFATGVACRQGTLTPPDTWSRPFGTCICSICWDQSFSELVVILPDYALRKSLGTFSILLSIHIEFLYHILMSCNTLLGWKSFLQLTVVSWSKLLVASLCWLLTFLFSNVKELLSKHWVRSLSFSLCLIKDK